MNPWLVGAGALALLLGTAHSYLGERYVLMRLFRRPLPPLFGDDTFTRRTLRFQWHLLTLAWWGMGGYLLLSPTDPVAVRAVAATFAASALFTLGMSRGRHLAWALMGAISGLAFAGA
ncbi:MAG TPA: hypothetical protein VNZ52_08565 [Candidatus Thermoplasmatota archaeon]|nr:hypothetical protein [Candidatus Thermoplasmatota archaeon]